MSQPEIPPWLREQLARFEQLQQNQLKNVADGEQIYKYAGSLLIKVSKDVISKELDEKKEISSTRQLVLAKQETRLKDSIKELQVKIDDALKGRASTSQPQGE
ncbi:MAG: prefoldin subunit [Thaumarchaeota archaeon]|nr:prefoldin subunit [Nitrososphaerota archaeon]